MVVLTGRTEAGALRGRVPEVALRRAERLPPGGVVVVLEEGDDVERGVPQAGRHGLLTHLDDAWQEPFAWVRAVLENGIRVFVARLAYGKRPVEVVAPDAPWLDSRVRLVLDLEAEVAASGEQQNCTSGPSTDRGF